MSENMEQFLELSVSPLIPSLPDDVTVDIVARVPRSHYPTLSLVSKKFRKLIASPKLYKRRSQLGITQHRVYAVLRNRSTGDFSFYITQQCVSVGILPSVFIGFAYNVVFSLTSFTVLI